MPWAADFETTTDPNDCRVWAWAACDIENPEIVDYGIDIASFIEWCEDNPGDIWFHNLRFDGEFIICYLLSNGWEHVQKIEKAKQFTTLISSQGQFYSIRLCFEVKRRKKRCVTFKDSLKKLPFSIDQIARSFNLPINKLTLDYETSRPVGHMLTPHERDYIRNDVQIAAMALQVQFSQGFNKLTIGSDALNHFKSMYKYWDSMFPVLPVPMDTAIRASYKGGWTYCDPRHQADDTHPTRTVGEGLVFDVNSLYPSVMYDRYFPVGEPVYFRGEYKPDPVMPLYIQNMTARFKLKPDHLPTIQLKHSPYYLPTQYLECTEEYVDLSLTSVDLALMFDQYDVDVYSYNGGYKFRQARGMFCEFIDYWAEIKANNTGGLRTLAKLVMNSTYGKFATNPDVTPKLPYLKEDGSVGYMLGEKDMRRPVYTPLGSFVTAWARDFTIRAAQANYDRFLYADTDSLHLLGTDLPDLEIHPTKLGAWAQEAQFSKAKYIRAKTYAERITHVGTAADDGSMRMVRTDPYLDVKCAGMPDDLKSQVTFKNFKRGLKLHGKLRPKHVPGGIVLEKTDFTLL